MDDLQITQEDNQLVIRGRQKEDGAERVRRLDHPPEGAAHAAGRAFAVAREAGVELRIVPEEQPPEETPRDSEPTAPDSPAEQPTEPAPAPGQPQDGSSPDDVRTRLAYLFKALRQAYAGEEPELTDIAPPVPGRRMLESVRSAFLIELESLAIVDGPAAIRLLGSMERVQAALDREPDERAAFLDQAIGADPGLRADVAERDVDLVARGGARRNRRSTESDHVPVAVHLEVGRNVQRVALRVDERDHCVIEIDDVLE